MKEKIRKILKDKLSKDVLAFFYQHQASIDTVGGITAWVHSDREKVKKVLDKLVELGILEEESISSTKGYCYTRDEKIMKIVKELMSAQ